MKRSIYIIFLLISFMLVSVKVNASSGRLKKDSIKTCDGIIYGQHSSDNHWHVAEEKDGNYYATGSAIYSNPCDSNSSSNENYTQNNNSSNRNYSNVTTTSKVEIPKSSDNTLKTIIIDDKEFVVKDNIEYSTTNEKVDIKVETNDDKATYEIKNNSTLYDGDNKIIIEVKAEDGAIKTYNININKKRILSSDTNVKVIIDEKEVNFTNYKANVYVASSVKNINFDYVLNDKNAAISIDKISELKTGNNIINIKVIAEDETKQNYQINIYKYSKIDDTIYTAFGLDLIFIIVYSIYYTIKRVKVNR